MPEEPSLLSLAGATFTITVEDGYLKAYCKPDQTGIITYGLEGQVSEEVFDGVRRMIEEYLEANR